MIFSLDEIVTRSELSSRVGAGGDSCFLHKNNTVVAIAMNPEKNPHAPFVLLVGRGPRKERYAQEFLKSKLPVPTFVKEATDRWRYVGNYRAIALDKSASDIQENAAVSGRNDIWGVMKLERG